MDLGCLLRPRSIAVIGGGVWCENVIRESRKIGFDGDLWAVHPTRADVGGVPAFASVDDLPRAPDAAYVAVNRHATIEVVRALSRIGAGGAICFASGFREAAAELEDGDDLQAKLLEAAGDMPILGPNCYGLINALDRVTLWPDHHGLMPVERGVAIITQSSNIALNLTMQMRGLPIAALVTIGNQAQIDIPLICSELLKDPRITALGLHIEGVGDLARFEGLAGAAHRAGKPIVALKVGASDQAQAAAISHTASLSGSAAGARALFDRLGIGQVFDLPTFLEVLKLLHVIGPLPSNRVASLSCSGGEASLMADVALGRDVVFPPLSERQVTGLRAALGQRVALANPLDYHTYIWADRAAMAACFSAMMSGDLALGLVVLDFPRPDRCPAPEWELVIDAVEDAIAQTGRPIAILSSLPETLPEATAQRLLARGILPLCGFGEALDSIAIAARIAAYRPHSAPLQTPCADGDTYILTEAEAKVALDACGLDTPQGQHIEIADIPADLLNEINGPFAVKALGHAHKTEAGAVALDVPRTALREAAVKMGGTAFLIEEMVPDPVAELLVGVLRDPAHGLVLTLSAGGILTELLADTQHLLLPTTGPEIEAALSRLRIAPLLGGFRGKPAADLRAIVSAVLAVQDYVMTHAEDIFEVEINPLICTPTRAVAADALIRLRCRDE
ncbi:acetate--CoA ligase family protein [Hasllibacter sp. MH4015]|uniref:acetate--CoA ligase family protein n=1 Tax=Hasllibacter sp. MH4015 TaxID=2854029 RepID=UPI001CD3F2AF|nr:acetate--CoA ligase family protein [Hasllibacter sp. MH4015]